MAFLGAIGFVFVICSAMTGVDDDDGASHEEGGEEAEGPEGEADHLVKRIMAEGDGGREKWRGRRWV